MNTSPKPESGVIERTVAYAIVGILFAYLVQLLLAQAVSALHLPLFNASGLTQAKVLNTPLIRLPVLVLGVGCGIWMGLDKPTFAAGLVHAAISGGLVMFVSMVLFCLCFGLLTIPNSATGSLIPEGLIDVIPLVMFCVGAFGFLAIRHKLNSKNPEDPWIMLR